MGAKDGRPNAHKSPRKRDAQRERDTHGGRDAQRERDGLRTSDTSEAPPDSNTPLADRDLLYVHSQSDGDGYRVIRSRDRRIEVGELHNLRHGQAIHGEVVRLRPIEGQEKVYDVEVLLDAPQTRSTDGPPQVATAAYRRNWEAIFGKPDVDPSAPN